MIIYPAIDLRGGQVVRLREGDPNQQIVFSRDPLDVAKRWHEQGANWIHMVNLDGAFSAANDNHFVLEHAAKLGVQIQFGGGLRTADDIEIAFRRGATRVVLGTIAIQQPQIVLEAIKQHGADAVCVALDARDGRVATHGWQTMTDWTPIALGKALASEGVKHALFTDVAQDGGLAGVNLDATVQLAHDTGLQVIASGGVSSLEDIQRLADSKIVTGAVIGMALYEGRFTLKEALAIAETNDVS
jgi:phosphoribosylformimino-5-aminoimidazole carboxamide ribotide isomerase